jgi:protein TonB
MKKLFDCSASTVFLKSNFRNYRFAIAAALLGLIVSIAASAMAVTEYDAADVDKPPKVVRQMPVKFPPQARRDGITGKVVVRCLIKTDGKADKMEIVESEPAGVFDESAMATLKYWQFRPGVKSGEMVATWVKVPFKFE